MERGWFTLLVMLTAFAVSCTVHRAAYPAVRRLLWKSGLVRANHAGRIVPTAGGVLVAANAAIALAAVGGVAAAWGPKDVPWHSGVLLLLGSLAAALWGFYDDWAPDKEIKGFRGHFSALVRERRLTSGVWKALGGGATALAVGCGLAENGLEAVLNAGILALSANAVNLFDLRPGRAIKAYALPVLASLAVLIARDDAADWMWILPGLFAAVFFFGPDARGEIMLGDAGANFLGFQLGFALVTALPPTARWGALLLLLMLHVLAEKISLSRLIESVGWLKRIDQWGCAADQSSSSSIRRMNRG